MRHLTAALAGALALASLAPAWANDQYQGTLKDNGRPVSVTLAIDAGAGLGKKAGTVRFAGQWACGFDLEFNGEEKQVSTYSLDGSGAGRCGPLTLGYLQSQRGPDGLKVQLYTQSNKLAYSLTLVPPGK
jgi:hypothetical protein